MEIERLIGRSLRSAVDMTGLGGEVTFTVDCDVLQADGGTRTAAITGAWVALHDALEMWQNAGKIKTSPIIDQVAAISVGQVDGRILLDLDYQEDSRAEVDLNLIMNARGEILEIQGTGEQCSFDRAEARQDARCLRPSGSTSCSRTSAAQSAMAIRSDHACKEGRHRDEQRP